MPRSEQTIIEEINQLENRSMCLSWQEIVWGESGEYRPIQLRLEELYDELNHTISQ